MIALPGVIPEEVERALCYLQPGRRCRLRMAAVVALAYAVGGTSSASVMAWTLASMAAISSACRLAAS